MYACDEDGHEKREKKEKRKRKEEKNLFIQMNRQTNRRTVGEIDRHKSFIDMRYKTKQYSKSNQQKR